MNDNLCAACEATLLQNEEKYCAVCLDDRVIGPLIMWVDTLLENQNHFMVMEQYRRYITDKSEEKPNEQELGAALAFVNGIWFHV